MAVEFLENIARTLAAVQHILDILITHNTTTKIYITTL